jgi:hypothetical protein
MQATRRHLIAAFLSTIVCSGAIAQSLPNPFVVYDDELKNNWQNWSWAKVQLAAPVGEAKPIKVEGDAWSALSLHHDAFSIEGFSKLTFYINGGAEGGQHLKVAAMIDGKAVPTEFFIEPKAKKWAVVEVPLKELKIPGKQIDGFILQGDANAYKPYYVTRIQFE